MFRRKKHAPSMFDISEQEAESREKGWNKQKADERSLILLKQSMEHLPEIQAP